MPTWSDEDAEDVSDNWDSSGDEAVEKKEKNEAEKARLAEAKALKNAGKKTLQQKIKEREEREKKERELHAMAPEERRKREIKEQEESELEGALEFVQVKDPDSIDISTFIPKSKHDFQIYSTKIAETIGAFSDSPFYVDVIVDLTRELVKPLKLDDTRRVDSMLKVQINALVKASRGKSKKSGKAGLNTGAGKTGIDTSALDGFDDMEDLM